MQTQAHFSTAVRVKAKTHKERERDRVTKRQRNQKLYFTRIVERDR